MNAAAHLIPTVPGDDLLPVLGHALSVLDLHDLRVALALSDLGSIDLPEGPSVADQAEILTPLGPFYLAYQLEQAGLLRTAELIAGLFASGAITASLGTAAELIRKFWQDRRNRLTEAERNNLYERAFEAPYFDRLFEAVMRDIAAHADNGDVADWREAIALEQSCRELVDFLAARGGGMTAFAARDIVSAINEAIRFLKDPGLQAAFSVRNLWDLVRTASDGAAASNSQMQAHVDLGKSGQAVFGWLAQASHRGSLRLDPHAPDFRELVLAATRWLQADGLVQAAGRALPARLT